jgi:hypothetical protein
LSEATLLRVGYGLLALAALIGGGMVFFASWLLLALGTVVMVLGAVCLARLIKVRIGRIL